MATKIYLFFLWFPCLSIVILSVYIITKHPFTPSSPNTLNINKSDDKIWPELEFNWRLIVATIIGFLGSAFGTVGGIFVPMLTLIVGFDTKSAAALYKCMIMGASASSVWYNLRVPHPCREVPILDYDLALLFQPMLMLGITLGVALSVVFPYWLITILIILLFSGTSARSFLKAIEMWKEETIMKNRLLVCSSSYWLVTIIQVASATATFVMMFSSSLSVVEFYLLKRFPIPFALYPMAVSVMAGFWGQFFIRRLITILKRASLIVFILSAFIFASAITMGVIGVDRSIKMIHNHEFMGFLQFCSSQ